MEDGPAISVTTAQMLTCTAALSWMLHDRDGAVLDLGAAAPPERGAAPSGPGTGHSAGAGSRAVSPAGSTCTTSSTGANGGRTDLDNLISLCKYHHMLVHERGYLIAADPRRQRSPSTGPDGTAAAAQPAPARNPAGTIADCHDAEITEDTIIPPWYGERLDLDHAIYTCLANARSPQERQARQARRRPAARDRV